MLSMIKELYSYRQLLKSNVKKEIRGKYKGSFLGVLWSFVNPLLMTLVYAIVFPIILKSTQPHYVTFIVIAILPWTWFTTVIAQGTSTMIANGGIIKKVYFPREILPISATLSGLVNFFIACLIIILFCVFGGLGLSWHILLVPFIALIQFVITAGMVLGLSAINVYIQDTEYIIQFVINMLFYGTPILYPAELFPEAIRWVLYLNPFTHIVSAYRDFFMYHTLPAMSSVLYMVVMAIICFVLGMFIFRKLEKGFAEEI